ncbi:MAG: hypothetical protein U0527_15040 [Candidatus Eisenbacteria bacterium]
MRKANLEAAGLACIEAQDGVSALREVAARAPALIVLDLLIPGRRRSREAWSPPCARTARC